MQVKMVVICSKFGLMELVNLIWLREVSVNGMVKLGINANGKCWKKHICKRIRDVWQTSMEKWF